MNFIISMNIAAQVLFAIMILFLKAQDDQVSSRMYVHILMLSISELLLLWGV